MCVTAHGERKRSSGVCREGRFFVPQKGEKTMKRMLMRMLALGLCLCALTNAALAGGVVLTPPVGNYMNVLDIVPVGEDVFLFDTSQMGGRLYRWSKGMEKAELAANVLYAERYRTVEEACKAIPGVEKDMNAAEHAISHLFTDGEKLYGCNGINGLVFAIEVTEDGLAYTDIATLANTGSRGYSNPFDVVRVGKWVLRLEVDNNTSPMRNRLLAFNLENNTVKQAVIPDLQEMTPYKDGTVLVICKGSSTDGVYTVAAYDPDTDVQTPLGKLQTEYCSDAAYSAELDMLIYQNNTRIMGWNPQNGTEQLGYNPALHTNILEACGDRLIYADANKVAVRSLVKGYAPENSLLLLNGNLQYAAQAFGEKYPDVPVYYDTARDTTLDDRGEDYAAILSQESGAPDMLRLVVGEGDYQGLLENGSLLDLSGYPEIKAYAEALYPVYQDLISKDGGIYAVPVLASSYNGWFINKEVMNAMGLKEEDIPTSLTEMCAFATRWNDEFAEKYPHYTLLNNTSSYRERLMEAILIAWSDYCQYSGKPLTFDDPVFREAVAALDAASLDKLEASLAQTNPEVSEYKQALIWTGCKTVANWASYMEDYSDRIFIPLTLTKDTPYVAAVENVDVWVVNAKSPNAKYAAALLAETVNSLVYTYSYALRTDKTEPLINEYYAESLAYEQKKLAALEESLEESVNRATIEKRIEYQKDYINNALLRDAYSVTPSAVENYVNVIAPASFIDMPDGITDRWRDPAVTDLILNYAEGKLASDELIFQLEAYVKK